MSALPGNIFPQPRIIADRVMENLLAADYRFAKTMPENPHWYTLRKTWSSDAAFVETVEFMRRYGYTEMYGGRKYTMFNLNGWKYWTMGAPINYENGNPCTILINHKPIDVPADYDLIADRYDELFKDAESKNEERTINAMLGARGLDRTLDIGCGTGLFLFYNTVRDYIGIDPSAKMLELLKRRFPAQRDNVIKARFEEFHDPAGFDLVVSLFGAINYISPAGVERVISLLRPGGRAFLMFYAERYIPVTNERSGLAIPYNLTSCYDLSKFRKTQFKDTYLVAEFVK